MRNILILLIVFTARVAVGQYAEYDIKGQYDEIFTRVYPEGYYDPVAQTYNPGTLGDGISYEMKSLLTMYKATGDRAYLVKFINESYHVIQARNDKRTCCSRAFDINSSYSANFPLWTDADRHSFYWNGLILAPMAEFVYLIKTQNINNIQNEIIPAGHLSPGIYTELNTSSLSYYQYAYWLQARTQESMDHINEDRWLSSDGYYGVSSNEPMAINMQSAFAEADLFLYGVTGAGAYYDKLVALISLYKGNIQSYCPDFFDPSTIVQDHPVFLYSSNTGGWYWYEYGWNQGINCAQRNGYEDAAHAIQTLRFVHSMDEYQQEIMGVQYFDDLFMERVRNTFTNQMYAGNYQWHNNTAGGEEVSFENGIYNTPMSLNHEIEAWMYCQKYDQYSSLTSNGSVYNSIMGYHIDNYYPVYPIHIEGATNDGIFYRMYGLSEVFAAQQQRECTNLNLYSRDLFYQQDFASKNSIIIDPSQHSMNNLTSHAFAEPVSFTANEFIIEPGAGSHMTASEEIVLNPGFTADAGSEWIAEIIPSPCTDGNRMAGMNDNTGGNSEAGTASASSKPVISPGLVLFPNPVHDVLYVSGITAECRISVYDVVGKCVHASAGNTGITQVDLSSLSNGVYNVRIETLNGTVHSKLIKQ